MLCVVKPCIAVFYIHLLDWWTWILIDSSMTILRNNIPRSRFETPTESLILNNPKNGIMTATFIKELNYCTLSLVSSKAVSTWWMMLCCLADNSLLPPLALLTFFSLQRLELRPGTCLPWEKNCPTYWLKDQPRNKPSFCHSCVTHIELPVTLELNRSHINLYCCRK